MTRCHSVSSVPLLLVAFSSPWLTMFRDLLGSRIETSYPGSRKALK